MSGCGACKTFDLGQWPRKADADINSEISLFGVVMWDSGRSSVLSWLATAYITHSLQAAGLDHPQLQMLGCKFKKGQTRHS